MTKYIHLTKKTPKALPRKKKKIRFTFRFKTFQYFIFVLFVVVGLAFLVQANALATKGYEITKLEQKIDELKQNNKYLEDKSLTLQSLQTLSQRVENLHMVKAQNVSHIVRPPTSVAVR